MAENKLRKNTNMVVLSGTVVKDPELKTVGNDFNILNFSIANNYLQKKGDKYEQEVSYFDIKVLGKRAESLSKILKKGFAMNITAEARQERWQDKNTGKTNSKVVFNANDVEITHWPSNSQSGNSDGQQASSQADNAPADNGNFSEDIPF